MQADEAFKQNLPSEPRCVIGETNKVDQTARVYIATYPGMMNRFAQLDVGFFDLIIADESHRSIYNKYRDLFDYFDALQIGLTATPVKFIARNTFDIFDCETTDPTFEFGLDAAINHEPPPGWRGRHEELLAEAAVRVDVRAEEGHRGRHGFDDAADRVAQGIVGRRVFTGEDVAAVFIEV